MSAESLGIGETVGTVGGVAAPAEDASKSYLSAGHTIRSWLLTLDHKRIAVLYLISISLFFVIGGLAAGAVRVELIRPRGTFMTNEMYNRMFTLHGVVMIFFFLIPAIPAILGNFLVPLMVGARDLAFPRLNLLSWYLYTAGGLLAITAAVTGGVDTGWTFTPRTARSTATHR